MSWARFARPGFAPSIAWRTPQRQMQGSRSQQSQRDTRCNDEQATIGTNDAPGSSLLDDLRDQRSSQPAGLLQELEEAMQRHIKDRNASLSGNFHLPSMQHLRQD